MSEDLEVLIAVREVESDEPMSFANDGSIRTHVSNKKYRDGWDSIFGNKTATKPEEKPIDHKNVN